MTPLLAGYSGLFTSLAFAGYCYQYLEKEVEELAWFIGAYAGLGLLFGFGCFVAMELPYI